MRKKMISLFALLSIALCTLQLCAQDLTWTIKSKKAKELVDKGMFHFQNVERELAYNDFLEALKIEPQCTIAQFMLTGLTVGETKKSYEAMARNSVKDKSEGEKMLVEHMGEYDNAESTRAFWEKMHAQFPDSRLFAYFYATSRKNGEEQFSALQEFNAKYPDVPEAYNILGYLNLATKKDTASAKANFEKYIALYPDGCNPYDSMGEFYFNSGDMTNAKKYYTMALEKYPFFVSSLQKMDEINKKEKETANASPKKE